MTNMYIIASIGFDVAALLRPEDVDCLCVVDSIGRYILDNPRDEIVPMMLSPGSYRNYSKEQDNLINDKTLFCNWVIGEYRFVGGVFIFF